jgi:hypothetical protein
MATVDSPPGRRYCDEELICGLLAGLPVKDAARASGISERTAHRRLRDADFRRRLGEARAGRLAAMAKAVEEMARRHIAIALAVQERVVERLSNLTPGDYDQMSFGELARLLQTAVAIERHARGQPDAITKSQTHTTHTGPASPRPIEGIGTIITTRTQAFGVAARPEADLLTG